MGLVLRMPEDGKRIELLPGRWIGKTDFSDEDAEEALVLEEMGYPLPLWARITRAYTEHGIDDGIATDIEMIRVVDDAVQQQGIGKKWTGDEPAELIELGWRRNFIERAIERGHDDGVYIGQRKMPLEEAAELWVTEARSAFFDNTMPDVIINFDGYRVEMLESIDPRVAFFDDIFDWSVSGSSRPEYAWDTIESPHARLYLVSKVEKRRNKPVAIAWAWRTQGVYEEVEGGTRPGGTRMEMVEVEPGPIVVIDAVQTIYRTRKANVKILKAIEALAHAMLENEETITEVRIQNDELSSYEVQEYLSSPYASPWKKVGDESVWREEMHKHPQIDKFGQGWMQTQWLLASRESPDENPQEWKCPLRTEMYGGMPEGGNFGSATMLELGAQNIAEAAHCILGSLGKLTRRGDSGQDEWARWQYSLVYEVAHLKEELGIINMWVWKWYEYGWHRDTQEKFNDPTPDQLPYVERSVENIRDVAPPLVVLAELKRAHVEAQEDMPEPIKAAALSSYDVIIAVANAVFDAVEGWPEEKVYNPFTVTPLQAATQRLGETINELLTYVRR